MNGQAVADAGGRALGEPGPIRVMAEMLVGRGFEVQGPVPEDNRHLAVVGAARARCEIGIDNGRLFSYYFPAAGNSGLGRHVQQLGPMTAGLAIQAVTGLHTLPISPWAGLGVLATWAAAALLAGGLLFHFRDA
jgi:hypothetical protein